MRYPIVILSVILLFNIRMASSQYYETGQDPASLKWLQIKTERFRVIYPESYGNEGILFAKSLEESYKKLSSIFPVANFRIPVIIHSYSTKSNGYVAWAPKRMEIYPAPDQNTIPLDTRTQLSIHELTHVFQLVSLNQGFSKAMSYVFGEQFAGVTSIMLPLWYFEGNAVFSESVLTESGRGRAPSFLKEFKAIAIENNKPYKYDRIVNDSYKKYTPDHYRSGYQIVTYAMAKEGLDLWSETLDFTARKPFLLDPVNLSLLRKADVTKRRLYTETFDSLKILWEKELSAKNITSFNSISPYKKEEYINYNSPVYIGRDSLLSIKTSMRDPASFVLIDPVKKTEKRIHTPGYMYPFTFSYGGGNVVWVENKPDPRWANRDYSVIKILELQTGTSRALLFKTRYLAASVSPNGSAIAAFENSIENINTLVLIDARSGSIIWSGNTPENCALQRPVWEPSGNRITFISLTEEGEGILSFSIRDKSWDKLVDYGRDDLQSSFLRNDSLFYVSSASGTEEIYLKVAGDNAKCISTSKYGINDILVYKNKILFSNYTATGYEICEKSIQDISEQQALITLPSSFLINRFENHSQTPSSSDLSAYNPVPYRKSSNLFRFHSWMPFYADIEEIRADPASVRPGITLMSQNHLSTLITTVGYEYSAGGEHLFHSKLTWQGWYPVIETNIDYGGSPGILTSGEPVGDPSDIKRGIRSLNRIFLPLSYATGRFQQYFQPSVTYDYRNNYIYIKEKGVYDYGQELISGRIFFSNYHRSSMRDIYPRWAQIIDFNYTFSPFNSNIYPFAASVRTSFYTPGLLPNNGIKIRYEKEKQGESKYSLNNRISLPRGYKNIISKDLELMSVDYAFPVGYPDFNISSLLYLKRIRCSLFGDYATGTDNLYLKQTSTGKVLDYRHKYRETFVSFGFEMLADFHVMRLPFMISGGVQTAWKEVSESPAVEVLLNIELFGMAINQGRYR